MPDTKIIITLEGDLPNKYKKRKKEIIEKIKFDAEGLFNEYEIWGEFFGDNENLYTFYLTDVCIE